MNKVAALLDESPEVARERERRKNAIEEARARRDIAADDRAAAYQKAIRDKEFLDQKRAQKEAAEDAAQPANLPAWKKKKMDEERDRNRKAEADRDARLHHCRRCGRAQVERALAMRAADSRGSIPQASPACSHIVSYGMRSTWRRWSR